MQVSNNTYLFVASCEIHFLNSGLEVIKACGEGDNFLSRHHFIAEATLL
jgi:hypothetical protein